MRGYAKQQLTFGEGFLDPELFALDGELQRVDGLLNERKLLAPFIEVFHGSMGRPGTPVDVYLRMMYLKFRYDLGYEDLQAQVRERLTWRRFCHLSLADKVPDATTLIKLNKRFGEERIKKLNQKLVKALMKEKAMTPRRLRIDSTTLEANVSYPTDVRLIHQVVKTLTRSAKGLGRKITSHVRATKKALARLGASLKARGKERRAQALKTLKQVNRLAQETVTESRQVLNKLRNAASARSRHSGTTQRARLQEQFAEQIKLAEQILEQTEQKLDGTKSIPERIVSFHDPAVRVIRKGKLGKPNEFGRTLELGQDASGLIVDYEIDEGNPSDKTKAVPMVKRFKRRFHRAPDEVAGDKGFYSKDNVSKLHGLGVKRVGIAKVGRLTEREKKHQRQKWFKELQRFRCGIEACISMLKRKFGLGRVLSRGLSGTAIWVGFSIFSYNLWQMAK
jgi:IS5 family transposase